MKLKKMNENENFIFILLPRDITKKVIKSEDRYFFIIFSSLSPVTSNDNQIF